MLIVGGFRSTMFPPIGPAVTQLPARSQRPCEFVGALAVSVPAGTVVASTNMGGEALFRPEMVSWAVQLNAWFAACHAALAAGGTQATLGVCMSMLIPLAVAEAEFPARSWHVPLAA